MINEVKHDPQVLHAGKVVSGAAGTILPRLVTFMPVSIEVLWLAGATLHTAG